MTADLLAHLETHIVLCAAALTLAILIGVPLASVWSENARARAIALASAGALRVVPSIAVLTLALPFLGLGFRPALLALVVLAIPPIALNTDAGLRGVAAPIREAARGLGMDAGQVRRRVTWPLAFPLVVAGIRTAAVEVIASATLAAFIGGGGLGEEIVDGIATNDVGELLAGAGTVALLALTVDLLLGALVRRASR